VTSRAITSPCTLLEERVDEGSYGGTLGKNDKKAEEQQEQEHRRQPPPLVLPKELKKLAGSVDFAHQAF
jgi:hypothetical protein